jgi:hypothetical protein
MYTAQLILAVIAGLAAGAWATRLMPEMEL